MKTPESKQGKALQPRSWLRAAAALAVAIALTGVLGMPNSNAASSLAEFNFDEGSGLIVKNKAGDLVGSLGVPGTPADDPLVITYTPSGAANDKAVQLQGNGFLLAEDTPNPILLIHTNAFTVEAWINIDPADTRQWEGIAAYGGAWKMGLRSGELIFTLFTIVDIPSGLFVPFGEWHHVAAVWEPGTGVTFYLDGANPVSVAEARNIPAPLNNILNIGAERLGNPLMGSLDRVRVHKAALTEAQLDSIATAPKAALSSTLVSYNFSETNPPFQNAAPTARPAITSNEYLARTSRPTFSSDTPSGLNGDYSLRFAAGQRVVVPDPNSVLALDQADPSFTVQAWVKFDAQPGARSVYFFNNAPGGAISASVTQDRRVFVTTLGIVDQTSTAFIPNDGGWHHIAVVHQNGVEIRFYVDGALSATVPYDRGVIFTRTNLEFYFGSEPAGGLQFVGQLDRFRYSASALPQNELDFWPVPGVAPAPMSLGIETATRISWPTLPAGYILQMTTDQAEPRTWVNVTNAPIVDNLRFNVILPTTEQKIQYRLIKP